MNVPIKGRSFRMEGRGNAKLKFGKNVLILTNVMYSYKLRQFPALSWIDMVPFFLLVGRGRVNIRRNGGFLFNEVLKTGNFRFFQN